LRDYFAERDAALRAQREALEEQERRAGEAAKREAESAETRTHARPDPPSENSHQETLLESAVIAALKPKYPKWPWIALGICLFLWYSCSERQSALVAEAQHYLRASAEMNSTDYIFGKGVEAFFRGLAGDPFGVAKEEFEKKETINSELQRIDSDYNQARTGALVSFLACLAAAGLWIWRHLVYRKATIPFRKIAEKIPS
jgi:hypothetical protein